MPLLNTADALFIGGDAVDKVYLGADEVWSASSWTPASLPNLYAWHDADDATSFTFGTGTEVAQWNDKSGNAHHITQSTAASRPLRNGTQNGRSTVAFDGTNDSLAKGTSFSVAQPFTVVAMFKWTTTGGDTRLFSFSNNIQLIISGGRDGLFAGSSIASFGSSSDTNPHCVEYRFNGASSAKWRDGVSDGTGNPGTASGGTTYRIGARADATLFGAFSMFEFIVVAGTISADDRALLIAYSQAKWATP